MNKVAFVVTSFTERESHVFPRPTENENWYATVLLRASSGGNDPEPKLADRFHPIYFANFRKRRLYAWSDWIRSPRLLFRPFAIDECCSGLPIRWYEEARAWKQDKANDDFLDVVTDGERIKYFVLRNVKAARYGNEIPDNLIRRTYATDTRRADWERDVGWELRTKGGDQAPMSQEIETEILVPIYDPSAPEPFGADNIIGVANFEWDEAMSLTREAEIGAELTKRIQESRTFPISLFSCDVLQHVTTPDPTGIQMSMQ